MKNTEIKTIMMIGWLVIVTLLYSCDPKTYGTVYLKNHSDTDINVHYKGYFISIDTTVQVNSGETVKLLGINHWGNPKRFDCCPCEFENIEISAADTTRRVIKSISAKENWIQDDSNLKMWKDHQIDCYFELQNIDVE